MLGVPVAALPGSFATSVLASGPAPVLGLAPKLGRALLQKVVSVKLGGVEVDFA